LGEIGQIFNGWVKEITKEAVVSVMFREVESLCGALSHPEYDSEYKRGGSSYGKIVLNGMEEEVIRPRVRKKSGKGKEGRLLSYLAARNGDDVTNRILRALVAGVSSRDAVGLEPGGLFRSKSSVSRLWISEGLKMLESLRSREIGDEEFFCLMLDGIRLSCDLTALAAMGITKDGRKLMLDFEMGSSESKEVCNVLLDRLIRRKFKVVRGYGK
jgi:transposase-like protein